MFVVVWRLSTLDCDVCDICNVCWGNTTARLENWVKDDFVYFDHKPHLIHQWNWITIKKSVKNSTKTIAFPFVGLLKYQWGVKRWMDDYHGRDCFFMWLTSAIMVMLELVITRKCFACSTCRSCPYMLCHSLSWQARQDWLAVSVTAV